MARDWRNIPLLRAKKADIVHDLNVGGVLSVGGATVAPSAYGDVYYVNAVSGSDDNDGLTVATAFASLGAGHDACTDNNQDVVVYIADSSGITLTETLTWSKNYTHLIGVCAPVGIANRARVFLSASADDVTPMVNITGSGCVFQNLYFFDGVDDAGCLVNVQVTGGRNYFENVHFAGIGHATVAGEANARSLVLDGAEECRFVDCVFGLDTVAREADNADVELKGAATRIKFEGCTWLAYTVTAGDGSVFVYTDAQHDIDRFVRFDDCVFLNQPAGVITNSVAKTQGMKVAPDLNGIVFLWNSPFIGCTLRCDDNTRVYGAGWSSDDYSDYSDGIGVAVALTEA